MKREAANLYSGFKNDRDRLWALISRDLRIVAVTALFALNPMIVFYGSNGMSEAPFVFFLVWSVRRLVLWMVDDDVHHLVAAGGIAMALAYLTRYDAVATVAAAGLLVGATTFRRARTPPRIRRALLDLLLVAGPGFAAFVGWAVASWLCQISSGSCSTQPGWG